MAAATQQHNLPRLSDDEVDDILYLTRTNETAELLSYLSQLAQQHRVASSAEVLEACVEEESRNTAFHYAAANGSTELLNSLLSLFPPTSQESKKALLNTHNGAGNTPLHWASLNGHASTVTALTEAGADVWVKNAAGNLPVFEAERAGKDEVVAVLLIAGGKEVEEGLKRGEGEVSKEEEGEIEAGQGSSSGAAGAAAAGGVEEAAEKLERTGLDG